jgi:galactokinase/mevalonate kinase-like predicted kinase
VDGPFSIRVSECGWPLLRYCGGHLLPHEIARESQLLEVENLKLESGVQDQLASAYGGVNFMEVEYPNARIFPIHLDPSVICELEDRLVLDSRRMVPAAAAR